MTSAAFLLCCVSRETLRDWTVGGEALLRGRNSPGSRWESGPGVASARLQAELTSFRLTCRGALRRRQRRCGCEVWAETVAPGVACQQGRWARTGDVGGSRPLNGWVAYVRPEATHCPGTSILTWLVEAPASFGGGRGVERHTGPCPALCGDSSSCGWVEAEFRIASRSGRPDPAGSRHTACPNACAWKAERMPGHCWLPQVEVLGCMSIPWMNLAPDTDVRPTSSKGYVVAFSGAHGRVNSHGCADHVSRETKEATPRSNPGIAQQSLRRLRQRGCGVGHPW